MWDKRSHQFIGINVFGIRLRHECFDRWIREKQSIQFVLENLRDANFDPEFFTRYEEEIAEGFVMANPTLTLNPVTK